MGPHRLALGEMRVMSVSGLRSRAGVAILLGSAGTTSSMSFRPNTRTPPCPSQTSGFEAGTPREQYRLTRQNVSEVRGDSVLRPRPLKTSIWRQPVRRERPRFPRQSQQAASTSSQSEQHLRAPQLAGMATALRHRHTWTRPTTIRIANQKHHPLRPLKNKSERIRAHPTPATPAPLQTPSAME